MSRRRIVILGGRGMLGTDLAAACTKRGLKPLVYDRPDFDLCDERQANEAICRGDAVVNCAAYTNVEKAEDERELAFRVNGEAVGLTGRLAKAAGVPLVHISTDFVFDGRLERPYRETDPTNPVSVYGASKLDGEKRFLESGCDGCILRVQWTYGRAGTNFVSKIIEAARTRDQLKVIDDQVGSPTATAEVSEAICDLLLMDRLPSGIYHLAAGGYVSRFGMAEFIVERLGLAVSVIPCKTSDFPTAAQRPLNSRFDCSKIEGVLGRKMRPWRPPLREFLEAL